QDGEAVLRRHAGQPEATQEEADHGADDPPQPAGAEPQPEQLRRAAGRRGDRAGRDELRPDGVHAGEGAGRDRRGGRARTDPEDPPVAGAARPATVPPAWGHSGCAGVVSQGENVPCPTSTTNASASASCSKPCCASTSPTPTFRRS